MNYWFTSDWHLGHWKICQYCNRPFNNIEDMDKCILDNYNSIVKSKDIVYFLGDFCFRSNPMKYIKQINTKQIHWIFGNHDKHIEKYGIHFASVSDIKNIKIDTFSLTLSHYAMRVWNLSHYGAGMLYGHSHGRLESFGKSFDVGVDSHNFYPWSFEQIKEKMATLPDNFNLVKEKKY